MFFEPELALRFVRPLADVVSMVAVFSSIWAFAKKRGIGGGGEALEEWSVRRSCEQIFHRQSRPNSRGVTLGTKLFRLPRYHGSPPCSLRSRRLVVLLLLLLFLLALVLNIRFSKRTTFASEDPPDVVEAHPT